MNVSSIGTAQLNMSEALFRAVAGNEFFLCLQPQYQLPDRSIAGAEALLRWNDPAHGIRFPAEFLPAAEHYGYAETLDLFALEEACRCIHACLDAQVPAVPISVNISSPSLYAAGFFDAVKDCIRRYNVPPGHLSVEFSAAFAEQHPVALFKAIKQFHALQCGCVIDGFSKGIALLERLCAFEIDAVKFDCGAFARQKDKYNCSSYMETLAAAQRMQITFVCEGVAEEEQLQSLVRAGCTLLQGFALSPPVSSILFLKMLQA